MYTKYSLPVKWNVFIVCAKCAFTWAFMSPLIAMKKEVILSVRVEPDIDEILRNLAKKDDRTVAWIVRKLLIEALEARRLLKTKPAK